MTAYDYRCQNGHVFSSPPAPHGGPWATLVCPTCGSTGLRYFTEDEVLRADDDKSVEWGAA